MQELRAAYLPPSCRDGVIWQPLEIEGAPPGARVLVPELSVAQLQQLAQSVRQAGDHRLKPMPLARIIQAVDTCVQRWLNPQEPMRQLAQAWLPRVTGLDPDMVRLGLNATLKTYRAPQLQRFVAEDFSNPGLLDGFQPRPKGGLACARGPELLFHVWAGNVPGLPLWSLISGLLVKAPAIGKLPSAEPVLAALFAQTLAEVEPALAECLALVWWKGGGLAREQAVLAQADTVVAYGANETLTQLGRRLPLGVRFLPHGHRIGVGLLAASALDVMSARALAHQAALDVVRYEQQGCYSPQVFYVARGGAVSPLAFAQYLAAELASLQHRFARPALTLEQASSLRAWRDRWLLRALSDNSVQVLGDSGQAGCVCYAGRSLPLEAGPLYRCVVVQALDTLDDAMPLLAARRADLQTAALAASPQELMRLAALLAQVGVTRICAVGAMTTPEAGWHHDGRFSLLDLVRMVEIEQSAQDAAESHAAYRD